MDLFTLAYGLTRLGFTLPTSDFAHLGSLALFRSSLCSDSSMLTYGLSCVDFLLSPLDILTVEFSLLLRSFVQVGSITSPFGMLRPDSTMLILD